MLKSSQHNYLKQVSSHIVGDDSLSTIRIGGVLDISTVDWRGHLTSMVFCAGCNLRCPFCSNSSLIPMDSGQDVALDAIERRILDNRGLLDAVGFTGGEPTLQPQPVTELCRWARENGLKTFLNTNGSNPDLVRELSGLQLLDYVALDVKAPLRSDAYGPVAGLERGADVMVRNVGETIDVCRERKVPLEVRTTVVPTLVDGDDAIQEIARAVRECSLYVLQEFAPFDTVLDERLRQLKPPSRELLVRLARKALNEGINNVYIRTRRGGLEKVTIP